MKILYAQHDYETGKYRIYYSVPDKNWFYFYHTTNLPLDTMTISEIEPDNQIICQDLKRYGSYTRVDDMGENKYHIKIENSEPVLYEKEGWIELVRADY